MELDEDFPDINAAPHIRFERFDREDDLIIEFDNMFSNNGKIYNCFFFPQKKMFTLTAINNIPKLHCCEFFQKVSNFLKYCFCIGTKVPLLFLLESQHLSI